MIMIIMLIRLLSSSVYLYIMDSFYHRLPLMTNPLAETQVRQGSQMRAMVALMGRGTKGAPWQRHARGAQRWGTSMARPMCDNHGDLPVQNVFFCFQFYHKYRNKIICMELYHTSYH